MQIDFENLSGLFHSKSEDNSYHSLEKVINSELKTQKLNELKEAYLNDDFDSIYALANSYLETEGVVSKKGQ
ncbi:MAG: hypothetical protein BM556_15655 [Bacteriovorax sp. MedPE-SWde]|nr:MAG: hypothetical protein BM556_15655 [Bacteriovorax sp. MedPE-SWde]